MHGRFYGLYLYKKRGNGRLGKHAIDTMEMVADSKTKGNMDLHATCLVINFNSCQGKDAGVLLRLHYSIHQYADIGCDTSF